LRRVFSRSYRNALAAEAAGDYLAAAEHYALAGLPAKVAEMHLIRAQRALVSDRGELLEDALRWLHQADDWSELPRPLLCELARSLLAEAEALPAGDGQRRLLAGRAATLYEAGSCYRRAAAVYEEQGQRQEALRCYQSAGELEEMERLMAEETHEGTQRRLVGELFDEYEQALALGVRLEARRALRRCCAEAPGEGYERKLEELEARFPAPGRARLQIQGRSLVVLGDSPVYLGRGDAHVALRHAGISRRHAAIDVTEEDFFLRDAGSRNGTLLGGMPLAGRIPLRQSGSLGLGEHCRLQFVARDESLELEVVDGPDHGLRLIVLRGSWQPPETPFVISFRDRHVVVENAEGGVVSLNGESTRQPVYLLQGDRVQAPSGELLEMTT
jgi:tetratricopeptide (TPR) repeat protein